MEIYLDYTVDEISIQSEVSTLHWEGEREEWEKGVEWGKGRCSVYK